MISSGLGRWRPSAYAGNWSKAPEKMMSSQWPAEDKLPGSPEYFGWHLNLGLVLPCSGSGGTSQHRCSPKHLGPFDGPVWTPWLQLLIQGICREKARTHCFLIQFVTVEYHPVANRHISQQMDVPALSVVEINSKTSANQDTDAGCRLNA